MPWKRIRAPSQGRKPAGTGARIPAGMWVPHDGRVIAEGAVEVSCASRQDDHAPRHSFDKVIYGR